MSHQQWKGALVVAGAAICFLFFQKGWCLISKEKWFQLQPPAAMVDFYYHNLRPKKRPINWYISEYDNPKHFIFLIGVLFFFKVETVVVFDESS